MTYHQDVNTLLSVYLHYCILSHARIDEHCLVSLQQKPMTRWEAALSLARDKVNISCQSD